MYRPHRFVLLLSSIIFAAFFTIVLLNIHEKILDLKTFQVERELPALGLAAYSQFNCISDGYKDAGEKLLENNYIRDWILNGEQNPEELIAFMESIREENSLLDVSLVSDLTETYYGTDGRVVKISPENEERDGWYYHYRESAEYTNIDSWFYPETGIIGLYVNIPVISEDGSFLGVTGGGVDASVFDRLLKYFEIEWDVELYIIRNDGHLLYATDSELIKSGKESIDLIWDLPVLDRITREKMNKAGIVFEPMKNEDTLLWAGYMSEWETFLIIERSSEDLNEKISSVVRKSLLFEGGITIIVFLISLFVLRYLSRENYTSMKTGYSYVHKLQSVVYIQSVMLKTSSQLLSTVAAEESYRNDKIVASLKLPISADLSIKQMEKINLNDMINEIIFKQAAAARRCGVRLIGQMPANQLIISSNESLLRFCVEHMLEENFNVISADSEVFFVAGSRGSQIWLDIVFQELNKKREAFDFSILEPVFEILQINVRIREDDSGSYILKLEFQPSGE